MVGVLAALLIFAGFQAIRNIIAPKTNDLTDRTSGYNLREFGIRHLCSGALKTGQALNS